MEKFTAVYPIDADKIVTDGTREYVRYVLNSRLYDEIINILSDGKRHLFRTIYSEEPEYGNITLCRLKLEVGTVHIHQYEMHVHNFSAEPMWKVTRSAIDELKYRIRSRWRKLWGAKK